MIESFTQFLQQHIRASAFLMPEEAAGTDDAQHLPFLFWLVEACNPRTIVHVGTNHPTFYYGYCYAVKALLLEARCFVIDMLDGEQKTSSSQYSYGDRLPAFCKTQFKSFSRLIYSSEDMDSYFAPKSIDFLHISGAYSKEYLYKVLASWEERLSDRAVIIIDHLSRLDGRDGSLFSKKWPTFEFWHAKGLGVITLGKQPPEALTSFFDKVSTPQIASEVRAFYANLGLQLNMKAIKENLALQLETSEVRPLVQELQTLKNSLSWRMTQPLRTMAYRFPKIKHFMKNAFHPDRWVSDLAKKKS